ncbi:GntP family transporter [Streptomyces lonegramiae]|uniref:GntP family transporter n=1 Tax=Streptomyces lonegramiae TaxID=3075524 RepID=A0ABU2X8Y3_9ACTN|nr:GntP family transporter [Streptomyces sp. DSM 41529]MDT0542373.1 GntP family transporter [Streptomyces sp. DSM 41529]
MSHGALLAVAAGGVALLLLMIIKAKIQPFVALVVVSIGVALTAGVPAAELVATIEEGMGSTLGHIATIIALGAMIGRIIELSGGAASLAHSLMERFGEKRTPLALTAAGFLLGIPVFFEVGLIILMPIAYGVARASRKPLLVYALPMGAAMLTVHAFLPPHPGAVAAATTIGADQGWVLLFGIPVTAVVILLGYLLAKRMTRREYPMTADVYAKVFGAGDGSENEAGPGSENEAGSEAGPAPKAVVEGAENPPSFGMVVSLIVTPIVLILLGTIGTNFLSEGSTLRAVLTVLGAPMVALLVAAALAAYFLGARRGWSSARISEVMGSALPGVAMVILVAGAGGVFGKVLVKTGIGDAVADVLDRTGLPLLALAFAMTMLLRAVQGSTTVALVTTAGLITPLLQRTDLSPQQLALVCLAMGAGGLSVSHINDAGYWMFTRLVGLEVGDGLRTWTVLTTAMGVAGFLLTSLLWLVV